jgi:hypothetical protein
MLPANSGITGDKIAGYVDAWRHAQAVAVKPAQPGGEGQIIALEFVNQPKLEFRLRSRKPEFILERLDLGLAYHFFPELAERLLPSSTQKKPEAETAKGLSTPPIETQR